MTGTKNVKPPRVTLKEQAAKVLLAATCDFLRRNKIPRSLIQNIGGVDIRKDIRLYRRRMQIWEYTGVLIATWYSDPRFLDKDGHPLPLPTASISRLIRASKVAISTKQAVELMQSSPSVKTKNDGTMVPIRKVFVLADSEVPRAALVVERYLDTLSRNASLRKYNATLLERSCRASGVDLSESAPMLRDIKDQAGAFMDSVDGEIEAHRARRQKKNAAKRGELGVVVFAWGRPNIFTQKPASRKSASKIRRPKMRMR